jgi:hypothetical protein
MRIEILLSFLLVMIYTDILNAKDNGTHSKNAAVIEKIEKMSKEYLEIAKGYKYLKDTLKVRVIYRELPMYYCGFLSTASLWLGVKNIHDTLTFISLCDRDSTINKNDIVYALPCDSIPFKIDIIGNKSELDNLTDYSRQYSSYYCNIAKSISK